MLRDPEKENAAPTGIGNGGMNEGLDLFSSISKAPSKYRAQAKWRENNPLARWAHRCVESAIKKGLLVRQCCEVCGDEKTDFHHSDYERPLHGAWLCRRHHKAEHARLGGTEVVIERLI